MNLDDMKRPNRFIFKMSEQLNRRFGESGIYIDNWYRDVPILWEMYISGINGRGDYR